MKLKEGKMAEIPTPELAKMLEGYTRAEWGALFGVGRAAVNKMVQRGRIRRIHLRMVEAFNRLPQSLREGGPGKVADDSSAWPMFRIKLAEVIQEHGDPELGPDGFVDFDRPLGQTSGQLAEYSEKELVDELERRGWHVNLNLKRDE